MPHYLSLQRKIPQDLGSLGMGREYPGHKPKKKKKGAKEEDSEELQFGQALLIWQLISKKQANIQCGQKKVGLAQRGSCKLSARRHANEILL